MTKSERDEIKRIIKSRFELLERQLRQRKSEVEEIIRAEVEEEFSDVLQKAKSETEEVLEEINKLNKKFDSLMKKYDPKGIEPRGDLHLEIRVSGFGRKPSDWRIKDIGFEVQSRIKEIQVEHGAAHINLEERKLKLLEEVMANSLESDDAKEFFERIPTVDDYIPLPNGKKTKELSK